MVRLASILVAIANAKNGVAFIDEFENGVHYSAMGSMWNAVATFSEKFNTQLFVTTHSAECIRAAHESFSKREYGFAFYRLYRDRTSVVAKQFPRDALEAALKADLELR